MKKYNPILRTISLVLVHAFLLEQFAFANPDLKVAKLDLFSKPKVDLGIPESIATIEDVWTADPQSGAPKTLYLLQDAHTNTSGQFNLSKTLDLLLKKEPKLKYIFIEAGVGNNSLSFLRKKGTPEERKTIAESFLRNGELHGEEYLDITSGHDFTLWGVEDWGLYKKALDSYKEVAKQRERFEAYLQKIRATIDTLKPRIFNPSLLSFDADYVKYKKDQISLTGYFDLLKSNAENLAINLNFFPHLKTLDKLKTKESKIDFRKANEEQALAIQSLSPQDQKEFAELVKDRRTPSKLSNHEHGERTAFYSFFEEKLPNKSKSSYPELFKYFDYLKEAKSVNPEEILKELKTLEKEIFSRLATSPDEKLLYRCQETLYLLEKLFKLTLTPDEYADYQTLTKDFGITHLTGFLNKKIMDLKTYYERVVFLEEGYEPIVGTAEHFYQLTLTRDVHFIEKALKKMGGEEKAILITGGFHTPNLKSLLKNKNISFVSLTPQVLHETNQARYEKILLNQANILNPGVTGVTSFKHTLRTSATATMERIAPGKLSILEKFKASLPNFSDGEGTFDLELTNPSIIESIAKNFKGKSGTFELVLTNPSIIESIIQSEKRRLQEPPLLSWLEELASVPSSPRYQRLLEDERRAATGKDIDPDGARLAADIDTIRRLLPDGVSVEEVTSRGLLSGMDPKTPPIIQATFAYPGDVLWTQANQEIEEHAKKVLASLPSHNFVTWTRRDSNTTNRLHVIEFYPAESGARLGNLVQINIEKFLELKAAGFSHERIAAYFKVDTSTITNRVKEWTLAGLLPKKDDLPSPPKKDSEKLDDITPQTIMRAIYLLTPDGKHNSKVVTEFALATYLKATSANPERHSILKENLLKMSGWSVHRVGKLTKNKMPGYGNNQYKLTPRSLDWARNHPEPPATDKTSGARLAAIDFQEVLKDRAYLAAHRDELQWLIDDFITAPPDYAAMIGRVNAIEAAFNRKSAEYLIGLIARIDSGDKQVSPNTDLDSIRALLDRVESASFSEIDSAITSLERAFISSEAEQAATEYSLEKIIRAMKPFLKLEAVMDFLNIGIFDYTDSDGQVKKIRVLFAKPYSMLMDDTDHPLTNLTPTEIDNIEFSLESKIFGKLRSLISKDQHNRQAREFMDSLRLHTELDVVRTRTGIKLNLVEVDELGDGKFPRSAYFDQWGSWGDPIDGMTPNNLLSEVRNETKEFLGDWTDREVKVKIIKTPNLYRTITIIFGDPNTPHRPTRIEIDNFDSNTNIGHIDFVDKAKEFTRVSTKIHQFLWMVYAARKGRDFLEHNRPKSAFPKRVTQSSAAPSLLPTSFSSEAASPTSLSLALSQTGMQLTRYIRNELMKIPELTDRQLGQIILTAHESQLSPITLAGLVANHQLTATMAGQICDIKRTTGRGGGSIQIMALAKRLLAGESHPDPNDAWKLAGWDQKQEAITVAGDLLTLSQEIYENHAEYRMSGNQERPDVPLVAFNRLEKLYFATQRDLELFGSILEAAYSVPFHRGEQHAQNHIGIFGYREDARGRTYSQTIPARINAVIAKLRDMRASQGTVDGFDAEEFFEDSLGAESEDDDENSGARLAADELSAFNEIYNFYDEAIYHSNEDQKRAATLYQVALHLLGWEPARITALLQSLPENGTTGDWSADGLRRYLQSAETIAKENPAWLISYNTGIVPPQYLTTHTDISARRQLMKSLDVKPLLQNPSVVNEDFLESAAFAFVTYEQFEFLTSVFSGKTPDQILDLIKTNPLFTFFLFRNATQIKAHALLNFKNFDWMKEDLAKQRQSVLLSFVATDLVGSKRDSQVSGFSEAARAMLWLDYLGVGDQVRKDLLGFSLPEEVHFLTIIGKNLEKIRSDSYLAFSPDVDPAPHERKRRHELNRITYLNGPAFLFSEGLLDSVRDIMRYRTLEDFPGQSLTKLFNRILAAKSGTDFNSVSEKMEIAKHKLLSHLVDQHALPFAHFLISDQSAQAQTILQQFQDNFRIAATAAEEDAIAENGEQLEALLVQAVHYRQPGSNRMDTAARANLDQNLFPVLFGTANSLSQKAFEYATQFDRDYLRAKSVAVVAEMSSEVLVVPYDLNRLLQLMSVEPALADFRFLVDVVLTQNARSKDTGTDKRWSRLAFLLNRYPSTDQKEIVMSYFQDKKSTLKIVPAIKTSKAIQSFVEKHLEIKEVLKLLETFSLSEAIEIINLFSEEYSQRIIDEAPDQMFFRIVLRQKEYEEMRTLYVDTIANHEGVVVPNHYAVMGVPRNSSLAALKLSRKLLTRLYHPDTAATAGWNAEEIAHAAMRFREIESAFDVLSDPDERAKYLEYLPRIVSLYPKDFWYAELTPGPSTAQAARLADLKLSSRERSEFNRQRKTLNWRLTRWILNHVPFSIYFLDAAPYLQDYFIDFEYDGKIRYSPSTRDLNRTKPSLIGWLGVGHLPLFIFRLANSYPVRDMSPRIKHYFSIASGSDEGYIVMSRPGLGTLFAIGTSLIEDIFVIFYGAFLSAVNFAHRRMTPPREVSGTKYWINFVNPVVVHFPIRHVKESEERSDLGYLLKKKIIWYARLPFALVGNLLFVPVDAADLARGAVVGLGELIKNRQGARLASKAIVNSLMNMAMVVGSLLKFIFYRERPQVEVDKLLTDIQDYLELAYSIENTPAAEMTELRLSLGKLKAAQETLRASPDDRNSILSVREILYSISLRPFFQTDDSKLDSLSNKQEALLSANVRIIQALNILERILSGARLSKKHQSFADDPITSTEQFPNVLKLLSQIKENHNPAALKELVDRQLWYTAHQLEDKNPLPVNMIIGRLNDEEFVLRNKEAIVYFFANSPEGILRGVVHNLTLVISGHKSRLVGDEVGLEQSRALSILKDVYDSQRESRKVILDTLRAIEIGTTGKWARNVQDAAADAKSILLISAARLANSDLATSTTTFDPDAVRATTRLLDETSLIRNLSDDSLLAESVEGLMRIQQQVAADDLEFTLQNRALDSSAGPALRLYQKAESEYARVSRQRPDTAEQLKLKLIDILALVNTADNLLLATDEGFTPPVSQQLKEAILPLLHETIQSLAAESQPTAARVQTPISPLGARLSAASEDFFRNIGARLSAEFTGSVAVAEEQAVVVYTLTTKTTNGTDQLLVEVNGNRYSVDISTGALSKARREDTMGFIRNDDLTKKVSQLHAANRAGQGTASPVDAPEVFFVHLKSFTSRFELQNLIIQQEARLSPRSVVVFLDDDDDEVRKTLALVNELRLKKAAQFMSLADLPDSLHGDKVPHILLIKQDQKLVTSLPFSNLLQVTLQGDENNQTPVFAFGAVQSVMSLVANGDIKGAFDRFLEGAPERYRNEMNLTDFKNFLNGKEDVIRDFPFPATVWASFQEAVRLYQLSRITDTNA